MSKSSYTPDQQRAIYFFPKDEKCKNLVIEAGAGSGKTTILKERVKFLLTEKNFLPEDLIVITFTKNATAELRLRIENLEIQSSISENIKFIQISTMDSFFISLVESLYPVWWDLNESLTNTMPSKLRLFSESEALLQIENNLIKNIELFTDCDLREIADFILAGGLEKSSGFHNKQSPLQTLLKTMLSDGFLCTSIEDIRISAQYIHPATQKIVEKCHEVARTSYEERIINGTLTYQDYSVFLKENLHISCPLYFKELIVDEYQDTNHIQHEILWKLVQLNNAQMTVVGDPKQSIYAFRGSHVDVFHSLLAHKEWNVIPLDINFRSTEKLLKELNTLSYLSFDWNTPNLPDNFKNSFFYSEALKKSIQHKALRPGIKSQEITKKAEVVLFEYKPNDSTTQLNSTDVKKRDFNEKNIRSFGCYLKKQIFEGRLEWKNTAILCEKNSQISRIKKIFTELEIPCNTDSEKQVDAKNNTAHLIALSLLRVLALKLEDSLLDQITLLSSPLTPFTLSEVITYFADKDRDENSPIYQTLEILKNYNDKFKKHAYIAWQCCRWDLAKQTSHLASCNDAFLFCQTMNEFSKTFHEIYELNGSKHILDILEVQTQTAPQVILKDFDENALTIKTVHGSKGLEWDVVCFYPSTSRIESRESFSISSSWPHLDLNWLSEDVKSLSYLEKQPNKKFSELDHYRDEKKEKIVWFSDLRKSIEKNFERQRIFYTAFTRPRKQLIFIHPERYSANSAWKFDKKFNSDQYEKYFEQDVFLKYAKLAQENKSSAEHIKHTEINFKTLSQNDKVIESEEKIVNDKQYCIDTESRSTIQNTTKQITEILTTPKSAIERKQRLRRSAHKGILFHARAENKIFNQNSIPFLIKKHAENLWSEFEILDRKDLQDYSFSRHVIDLLAVFSKENFNNILHPLVSSAAYFKWNFESNSNYVFLIVDFKTGSITTHGIQQVTKYSEVIEKMHSNGLFNNYVNTQISPNIASCLLHNSHNSLRSPN